MGMSHLQVGDVDIFAAIAFFDVDINLWQPCSNSCGVLWVYVESSLQIRPGV